MRCDDSVARMIDRRDIDHPSRAWLRAAADFLRVPFVRTVLACGAHLKNTFCLAQDRHAFLSHHIGDLENYETLDSFTQGIEHFKNLFAIEPQVGRARSSPRLSLHANTLWRSRACRRSASSITTRTSPVAWPSTALPARYRRCLRRIGLWGRWHDLGWRISDRGFIAIRAPRPFAQRAHGGRRTGPFASPGAWR